MYSIDELKKNYNIFIKEYGKKKTIFIYSFACLGFILLLSCFIMIIIPENDPIVDKNNKVLHSNNKWQYENR